MAAPTERENVRIKIHFEAFRYSRSKSAVDLHDHAKRWALLSYYECPTIKDIAKKVIANFRGKLHSDTESDESEEKDGSTDNAALSCEIWLDGYWLPSYESSRILRDGDKIKVKTNFASAVSSGKNTWGTLPSGKLSRKPGKSQSDSIEAGSSGSKKQRLSTDKCSELSAPQDRTFFSHFYNSEQKLLETGADFSAKKKKKKKKKESLVVLDVPGETDFAEKTNFAGAVVAADKGWDEAGSKKRKRREKKAFEAKTSANEPLAKRREMETPVPEAVSLRVNKSASVKRLLNQHPDIISSPDAVSEPTEEVVSNTEQGEVKTHASEHGASLLCNGKLLLVEQARHDIFNSSSVDLKANRTKGSESRHQIPDNFHSQLSKYFEPLIRKKKEQLESESAASVEPCVPRDTNVVEREETRQDKHKNSIIMPQDVNSPCLQNGKQQNYNCDRNVVPAHNLGSSLPQTYGDVQELAPKKRRRKRKKRSDKNNGDGQAAQAARLPHVSHQAQTMRDYSLRLPPHLRPRPDSHVHFDDNDDGIGSNTTTPGSMGAKSGVASYTSTTTPNRVGAKSEVARYTGMTTPNANSVEAPFDNTGFTNGQGFHYSVLDKHPTNSTDSTHQAPSEDTLDSDMKNVDVAEAKPLGHDSRLGQTAESGENTQDSGNLTEPASRTSVSDRGNQCHTHKFPSDQLRKPRLSNFVSADDKFESLLLGNRGRTSGNVQATPVVNERNMRKNTDRRENIHASPVVNERNMKKNTDRGENIHASPVINERGEAEKSEKKESIQATPVNVTSEKTRRGEGDKMEMDAVECVTARHSSPWPQTNVPKVVQRETMASSQHERDGTSSVERGVTVSSAPATGQNIQKDLMSLQEKLLHHPSDAGSLQVMKEPPKPGDIIMYKVLELSAAYTPGVSDFKQAQVLQIDSSSGQPMLELLLAVPEEKRTGRFELEVENANDDAVADNLDEREHLTTVCWLDMIEPKLIVPR